MRPLLDTRTLRIVDARAQKECGIGAAVLMESAGQAIWHRVRSIETHEHRLNTEEPAPTDGALQMGRSWPGKPRRLTVLAGPGNNGGDGLVLARYAAAEGWNVRAVVGPGEGGELYRHQRNLAEREKLQIIPYNANAMRALIDGTDILVDALLGTGQRLPLTGWIAECVDSIMSIRQSESKPGRRLCVVALDVPTGLGPVSGERFIEPDRTLMIGAWNRDLLHPSVCGKAGILEIVTIGFPQSILTEEQTGWMLDVFEETAAIPACESTAYKTSRGSAGSVCAAGGSPEYPGAPYLTLTAAAAVGAGLLYYGHFDDRPEGVSVSVPIEPGFIPLGGLDAETGYSTSAHTLHAIAAGSGWTTGDPERKLRFLREIIDAVRTGRSSAETLVLDAGAIRLLASDAGLLFFLSEDAGYETNSRMDKTGGIVLTPHLGELKQLIDVPQSPAGETNTDVDGVPWEWYSRVAGFAKRYGVWMIVKYSAVHIAGPRGEWFSLYEPNPVLGFGGSGDILSGIIIGLAARFRGYPLSQILRWAVCLHSLAGLSMRDSAGFGGTQRYLDILGKIASNSPRTVVFRSEDP